MRCGLLLGLHELELIGWLVDWFNENRLLGLHELVGVDWLVERFLFQNSDCFGDRFAHVCRICYAKIYVAAAGAASRLDNIVEFDADTGIHEQPNIQFVTKSYQV